MAGEDLVKIIEIVNEYKLLITETCKKISNELQALKSVGGKTDKIEELIIELSNNLSNIGGFCSKSDQIKILKIEHFLSQIITFKDNDINIIYELKSLLPFISGFIIDFKHRPFKLIDFEIESPIKEIISKFKLKLER